MPSRAGSTHQERNEIIQKSIICIAVPSNLQILERPTWKYFNVLGVQIGLRSNFPFFVCFYSQIRQDDTGRTNIPLSPNRRVFLYFAFDLFTHLARQLATTGGDLHEQPDEDPNSAALLRT